MAGNGAPIERHGARVLFLDGEGRLLLVRGHDPHAPERSFWFTPGGGIEPGETAREAAVRELAEETGYVVNVADLRGPVWTRTAVFDFASRPYVQHEQFFVACVADAGDQARVAARFTADEQEALDEVTWLSEAQVHAEDREVFPHLLRESWDVFRAWDGVTRDVGRNNE